MIFGADPAVIGRLRFAHRRWSGFAPSRFASPPYGDHQLSQGGGQ